MNEKIKQLFILPILFLLIIGGCGIKSKEEKNVNLTEAIEIGKKALKEHGYPYCNEELVVEADDNNTVWKEHIASEQKVKVIGKIETVNRDTIKSPPKPKDNIGELKKKIMSMGEKEYWAIYYFPKKWINSPILGGDAFVFIRRTNGEVIGVILGE